MQNMESKKIVIPANRTNCVKFGKYVICLEKEQLNYYIDGSLNKVADVNHDFSVVELYELATRITEKNGFGPVNFVHKVDVVKKY
jgi:hypothetical protein